MRIVVIVLLATLWLALAYRAYSRGEMGMAGLYLSIGGVLTAYRLVRKN
jgi:hypothetical protein